MKRLFMLCIGLLFMVACEKKSTHYEITVEKQEYTLDNQGKGTISCKVTPEDLDLSKLTFEYVDNVGTYDDIDWQHTLKIISITKDTKTPGKWNLELGLGGTDGNLYPIKPTCTYDMDLTVLLALNRVDAEPIVTNKFHIFIDIKPSL